MCDKRSTPYYTIPTFNAPEKEIFENIVGKGENAGNQHFSFSYNVFYRSQNNFNFKVTFILLSANEFNLDQSKILFVCLFVWDFMPYQQYFSYLTTTVHKSMFPGLFLTSTYPGHYPDNGGPVIVLFPKS